MLSIDTRKIFSLSRALKQIGRGSRRNALHAPLNAAGRPLHSALQTDLAHWTGLPGSTIAAHITPSRASAGHLSYTVRVRSKWFAISKKNFGATWSRAMPGVSHTAWGRPTVAEGTFMARGKAFKRISADRYPLEKLWGPNIARELERHTPDVQAKQAHAIKSVVQPDTYRNIDRETAKAKAQNGL